MRAELGIPDGGGILEEIDRMTSPRREDCHRRLLEMELAAAAEARLIEGAVDVLAAVQRAGIKTALLTRNAAEVVSYVLGRFEALRFDLAWSRENGPIKPEPVGVQRACRQLGLPAEKTVCVGDFYYDIVAANAAGCVSVLFCPQEIPEYAAEADHVIRRLDELPALLGIEPEPAD
jgi:HAD superfamily hydrolase (TIGR01549 family)